MTYKSEVKNDKGYDLVINDVTFKSWITALEQKKKTTAHSYKYGIIYFSKFCNKLPNELLNEAKEDYINKVPPWDLRHVHDIERFATYLLTNQDQSVSSKLNYIKSVKHFYNHFKIPVIGVKHNLSQGITEKYQNIPLLKIEDIRKAVLSCGSNLQAKSMILGLISSGQGQYELRSLKGKHLRNIVNGIAIVDMVRGKTGSRYTFILGKEAIEAIKEYKPNLKDDEYVFSKVRTNAPLSSQEFDNFVKRVAVNAGLDKSYFMPHRFRHFFKSTLAGQMETTFIEFLMGHKLPGVESSYFLFNKDKMIESYLKNQHLLSVYNDSETLQKELDELKQKDRFEIEIVKGENNTLKAEMDKMKKDYSENVDA